MKIIILLTFLLILFLYNACSEKTTKKQPEVLDLAHRGYASKHQEATLEAFMYAIEENSDGLEFDIRQTKDGVIVIAHDHKINKLEKNIAELNYLEIQKHTSIVTFRKIIKLAKEHQKDIWVEIKDSELYPKIIDHMLEIIKEEKYAKKTIIQSFKLSDLKYIHSKNINIRLLKLYIFQYSFDKLPKYINYIGLPIVLGLINSNIIASIHKSGYKIVFWRESSIFEKKYFIRKLINSGADGFMLDSPLKDFK